MKKIGALIMKYFKKALLITAAVLMALSLASCGEIIEETPAAPEAPPTPFRSPFSTSPFCNPIRELPGTQPHPALGQNAQLPE